MTFYSNPVNEGLDAVAALNDGSTINIQWFQAYPTIPTNKIAYHIYFSTVIEGVYTDGVKYISIDDSLQANIIDLTPGQEYFFSVRALEYNPSQFNLDTILPTAYDNLRFYPSSMLSADISATDLTIPLLDTDGFPGSGIVKVGVELIAYASVSGNNLLVDPNIDGYGYLVNQGTIISPKYYLPVSENIGDGYINGLTLLSINAPVETWTVRCISDTPFDGYGNPLSAQFLALGNISGGIIDGYGNPFVWKADGYTVSNGILSFNITNGLTLFKLGDGFTVKVGQFPRVPGGRGYNTVAYSHTTDGYDGYDIWNPIVNFFIPGEYTLADRIYVCQCRFEYPHYAYTLADGYHQVLKDLLSTDLTGADEANVTFPPYDFAGYHRTDPVQVLDGTCVGTYIGGELGCIDGYGVSHIVRGLSLQDQNTQRQDVLLSVTGKPAVLIRRVQTGITCSCYLQSSEYPDDRCPMCYGTKFVFGYEQYFNPRRADGRILVRPGPTAENLRMRESGLESEFPVDFWTLTVPTIKTRDVLILFDQDNNEEFRYEVTDVIRNNTILGLDGGQHLKTLRIRKFDPAYQIRAFRDTSMFPSKLNTGIGMVIPGIPPHTHEIVISEKITALSQINQTTAVSQGHNHPIVNGVVKEVLGHTHTIILP